MHPHLAARGYIVEVQHPLLGALPVLGPPFRLPASPGRTGTAAPLLGQHNAQVFGERLGIGESQRGGEPEQAEGEPADERADHIRTEVDRAPELAAAGVI